MLCHKLKDNKVSRVDFPLKLYKQTFAQAYLCAWKVLYCENLTLSGGWFQYDQDDMEPPMIDKSSIWAILDSCHHTLSKKSRIYLDAHKTFEISTPPLKQDFLPHKNMSTRKHLWLKFAC